MQPDGTPKPTGGTLTRFPIPSRRGVRTDSHGYTGYTISPAYDSPCILPAKPPFFGQVDVVPNE